MKRNTLGWALALAFCSLPAIGQAPGAGKGNALAQAEASMLVTGDIAIDPAGHVTGYAIDDRAKVPAGVTELIDQSVPHWAFEPEQRDGSPVPAKATMRLLVVAGQADATHYRIEIRSAAFEDPTSSPGSDVSSKQMKPPRFPQEAFEFGLSGTVYLRLKIDRSGRVADEIAEQVNLRRTGSARQMDTWRAVLSRSALRAAARWTFNIPTTGSAARRDYWDVTVPVVYRFADSIASYGGWEPYIPGPHQAAPWADPDDVARAHSNEALADGSVHLVGSGLQLLTPLGG